MSTSFTDTIQPEGLNLKEKCILSNVLPSRHEAMSTSFTDTTVLSQLSISARHNTIKISNLLFKKLQFSYILL